MQGFVGSLFKYIVGFMFLTFIIVAGVMAANTNEVSTYQHHINTVLQQNGTFGEPASHQISAINNDYHHHFYVTPNANQKQSRFTFGQPMKYTIHTQIPVMHNWGASFKGGMLRTSFTGSTQSQTGNE